MTVIEEELKRAMAASTDLSAITSAASVPMATCVSCEHCGSSQCAEIPCEYSVFETLLALSADKHGVWITNWKTFALWAFNTNDGLKAKIEKFRDTEVIFHSAARMACGLTQPLLPAELAGPPRKSTLLDFELVTGGWDLSTPEGMAAVNAVESLFATDDNESDNDGSDDALSDRGSEGSGGSHISFLSDATSLSPFFAPLVPAFEFEESSDWDDDFPLLFTFTMNSEEMAGEEEDCVSSDD